MTMFELILEGWAKFQLARVWQEQNKGWWKNTAHHKTLQQSGRGWGRWEKRYGALWEHREAPLRQSHDHVSWGGERLPGQAACGKTPRHQSLWPRQGTARNPIWPEWRVHVGRRQMMSNGQRPDYEGPCVPEESIWTFIPKEVENWSIFKKRSDNQTDLNELW